jgi:hypothetical protein
MKTRVFALGLVALMAVGVGWAKKKEKQPLPDVVLKAQTVFVTIQPGANEPASGMTTNQKTVKDVEEALMKWGRFRLALNAETADIVIAVMKGSGKAASPTVSGGPVDSRPVILDKTDNQIRIGGQQGRPPAATQTNDPNTDGRAHPGMQVGSEDDLFKVYLRNVQYPLDAAPVWSYTGHDALKAPSVPAVEQFRKAVEESEKVAAQKQQEKQKQQQQQQQQQPQPTTRNGT